MPRKTVIPFLMPEGDESIRPTGLPLPQLWDKFMRFEAPSLSPSRQKAMVWTRKLIGCLGDHPSVTLVKKWRHEWLDVRYKGKTPQHHCWNVGRVYSWGGQAGLSHGNPVALCKFKAPDAEPRGIRNIERVWPQVLACAGGDRERAFLAVLRYTGCRLSEALGLREGDVIPQERDLLLSFTGQRKSTSWERTELKGKKKSHRGVYARPELAKLLRKVLGLGKAKVWFGHGGRESRELNYLFPFRPYDLQKIGTRLKTALPLFFSKGNVFHVIRHSFAWEIRASGQDVVTVQKLLGHTSSKTTDAYLTGLMGSFIGKEVFAGLDPVPKKQKRASSRANVKKPRSNSQIQFDV